MNPNAPDSPIRVALLLDSIQQPRWVSTMVQEILALPYAEISLLVLNDATAADHRPRKAWYSSARSIFANRRHLLYTLYMKADTACYRTARDPFTSTNLEEQLTGCPRLRVRPRKTRFCDYFTDADVEAIQSYELDVAIRLGFRILKGRVLDIARYGVWSYHHGDNQRYRGGPAGFWEVMEANPVTGSILQILNEELDGGRVLYRAFSRSDRMSVWTNRSNYYWKSAPLVARKLRDLHAHGPEALAAESCADHFRPYSHRLYKRPENLEMAQCLGRLAVRRLGARLRQIGVLNQWILGYKLQGGGADTAGVPNDTLHNFKVILPPKDRFWADPFPVSRDGGYFVFCEEMPYARNKGHISVFEIGGDGTWSTPTPVLERPYHLSYPFVFEWRGELFMIPETSANRTVEVYRCISFPDHWEPHTVLLDDLWAVDATLAELGDRWWMFVSVGGPTAADCDDELYLYHAPTPLGPWKPHRRNPVKTDVRSSRPAGRLFESSGNIYRPAQDCAERYGHSIAFSQIAKLSPTEFDEVTVSRLLPRWRKNLLGTHTINSVHGLTVVDGLLRRSRFGSRASSR